MQLIELLQSTIQMGYLESYFHDRLGENRRDPSYVFTKKEFGPVYWDNLVIAYKGDIIEITLIMGSVTDMHKSAHRVSIALKGIDYDEVTDTSLVKLIKEKNPNEKESSKESIITKVLGDPNYAPLEGKTIIQKSTAEKKFFILPNKIDTSVEIAVRCTCSDFYFAWAWYNADHGCLIGTRPPAYKRVYTDDKGRFRTSKNPHRMPGMCKHVMLFLALLMRGGLIQNLPTLSANVSASQVTKIKRISKEGINALLVGLKDELKELGEIREGWGS